MDKLWTKRRPPTPLEWDEVMAQTQDSEWGTINSKINDTLPKGFYLRVSKLATFDFSRREFIYLHIITYSYVIMGKQKPLGVPFILLLMVLAYL